VLRLPPEERFWQRYSPHHEFPLSSTASVALHVLVLVLLLVVAWVVVKLGLGADSRPLPVTPVALAGGGGNPHADGAGPGDPGALPPDDVGPAATPRDQPPPDRLPELNPGDVLPPPLALPAPKDGRRIHADDVQGTVNQLVKDAKAKLGAALGGAQGKHGPGDEGGAGPGHGPGTGPGVGPGKRMEPERVRRAQSWSLTFNTHDGEDYVRQLRGLRPGGGAILAVPTPDRRFRVIRDLSRRPAVGNVEDVTRLNRIFWIDDKPESVANLARALGIPTPAYIVAFFPEELEAHLADLEKARLAQEFPGRTVQDIAETRFDIVRTAGDYEARVVSVTLRR
jgi:hypothetical protein